MREPQRQHTLHANHVGQDDQPIPLEGYARVDHIEGALEFEQHLHRAVIARMVACTARVHMLGREDRDLRDLLRALEERFERLYPRIGWPDAPIGIVVDRAVRMKLVADQAFRAKRDHLGTLVLECLRMLETTKFAPARMELAGMGEKVHAERRGVTRARWKVVIAPATGRQAFKLEMGIGLEALGPLLVDMARV